MPSLPCNDSYPFIAERIKVEHERFTIWYDHLMIEIFTNTEKFVRATNLYSVVGIQSLLSPVCHHLTFFKYNVQATI